MSDAVWYWREGETQHGPMTWDRLQAMAESGKIAPNDWVFREGWVEWKLACEAKDASLAAVPAAPALPALPPLPPLPQMGIHASTPIPPGVVPGAFVPVAPLATMAVPISVSAAMPMPMPVGMPAPLPLPPLSPEQTVGDIGPMPPSADGISDGDVRHLRRVLRDDPNDDQPAGQWNPLAAAALAASLVGLMFLAFEMGLLGVGLGGWCLYISSQTRNPSGKGIAITAVAIGFVNVIFRVLCATVDIGLTHM